MCAFSYAWSLPVTWQTWHSHHSIRRCRKPHAAHGCMFYRTGVISTILLLWPWLDPMTFIYELDRYSLEIYRMCENELCTSGLSKVIVWQTCTIAHTYRQTRPKLYTTPLRGWSPTTNRIRLVTRRWHMCTTMNPVLLNTTHDANQLNSASKLSTD